jgi:hypothetical protein
MRRYAVLDLQADHHLNADLKDQGGIERRLKKEKSSPCLAARETPTDSRGIFFLLTAIRNAVAHNKPTVGRNDGRRLFLGPAKKFKK